MDGGFECLIVVFAEFGYVGCRDDALCHAVHTIVLLHVFDNIFVAWLECSVMFLKQWLSNER